MVEVGGREGGALLFSCLCERDSRAYKAFPFFFAGRHLDADDKNTDRLEFTGNIGMHWNSNNFIYDSSFSRNIILFVEKCLLSVP